MKVMNVKASQRITVADEVWVATALLHRENPRRLDFKTQEIVNRAAKEGLHGELRPGVYVHVAQHSVANRRPNPGRYRMLYETRPGHRRLFVPGDDWHPERKGGRIIPVAEALPEDYRGLLDWYERWSRKHGSAGEDPILALRGLGREIWNEQEADEYVAGLRSGWE